MVLNSNSIDNLLPLAGERKAKKGQDSQLKGFIFQIQKWSTEDGPGIRTTVFLKGCPLKCVWCHNPESISPEITLQWYQKKCIGCLSCVEACGEQALQMTTEGLEINRSLCTRCGACAEACPAKALKSFGDWWSLGDIYDEIKKDQTYYKKSKGGVTFSGGEPTIQHNFLLEILKKCKKKGFHTALDTCGFFSWKKMEQLLPWVDLVLLDIKHIDPDKHKKYTGRTNLKILENARKLAESLKQKGKSLWIRTPLIPHYTAEKENVRGIGDFIVTQLGNNIDRWDLLAFNNLSASKYERMDGPWALKDVPLLKKEEMEYFKNIAIATGANNVQWSGMTKD